MATEHLAAERGAFHHIETSEALRRGVQWREVEAQLQRVGLPPTECNEIRAKQRLTRTQRQEGLDLGGHRRMRELPFDRPIEAKEALEDAAVIINRELLTHQVERLLDGGVLTLRLRPKAAQNASVRSGCV